MISNKKRSNILNKYIKINIVKEVQLQILKSTNFSSTVKFEKSVKRDRSAAMRFAIRVEQTLRRGCMVSRAYLRTPLRGKDSCHECSRIKETTNSAQRQNIFITPSPRCRSGGDVVGKDTREGVRFRHESSANERVCRPYRNVGL